jgi:CheY-like chemotaxis protein
MPAKVLVVEDDLSILELIVELFRVRGHTVTAVDDGPAALTAARLSTPDIVVCDINLPSLSGFEVLKGLR